MIKKIDLENHYYDVSSVEALQARGKDEYPHWDKETNSIHWVKGVAMCQDKFGFELLDFAEKRLKIMDQLGIEKAVISLAPGVDSLPPGESIPACRKANEALSRVTRQFPDRFLGAAILPILDVEESVKELDCCVQEYGFVMWQTHSNYGPGIDPDQPQFRPVWRRVAELGIFGYLHPTVSWQPKFNEFGYAMAGPALGFTIDTMASILRMILSGIFDEIPDLKVVLGHFGEALPFLLERINNRTGMLLNPLQKNRQPVSSYWGKNIFVTTSGNTSVPAFECTRAAIGIDSILLGTDYPFEHMEDCVGYLETCPMTQEEREKVYYKNAAKLGLTL